MNDNRKNQRGRKRPGIFKRKTQAAHLLRAGGVITVEAAFLYPLLMILTLLMITCLFYRHNAVWYGCAALETAMAGNDRSAFREDALREMSERILSQPFPGSRPGIEVRSGNSGTAVSLSGSVLPVFPDLFQINVSSYVHCVSPWEELQKRWCEQQQGE